MLLSSHNERIGLGLAALGRPGYINLGHGDDLDHDYDLNAMQAKVNEMLDLAYSLGTRYFDVARSYGNAEQFLANWLSTSEPKKDLKIGSKWGYTYTAGWEVQADKHEVKEHSIERVKHQWAESKNILGNTLNVYHIHSATLESGVLDNAEVLDYLWKIKEQGTTVGISTSGVGQKDTIKKALSITQGDNQLFQSFQVTWNVFEQSTTQVLNKVKSRGGRVIVKEAVANGRLTSRNASDSDLQKMNIIQSIADYHEVGVDAVAMAYVLQQDFADIVLSGAATKEQLESNFQSTTLIFRQEDINVLDNLSEPSELYWKTRSRLKWN